MKLTQPTDPVLDIIVKWRNGCAKAAEKAGASMFLGKPDAWFEDPTWACSNGHVSSNILKCEDDSDCCLACHRNVVMVPPDTTEKMMMTTLLPVFAAIAGPEEHKNVIVLEDVVFPRAEDGGQALIAEIVGGNGFFVRLQSWFCIDNVEECKALSHDEKMKCIKHPVMDQLSGKRVRVTIETIE